MTEIHPSLWKSLNETNEMRFRKYARDTYHVGSPVDSLWHPVVVHECYLMNKEAGILSEV